MLGWTFFSSDSKFHLTTKKPAIFGLDRWLLISAWVLEARFYPGPGFGRLVHFFFLMVMFFWSILSIVSLGKKKTRSPGGSHANLSFASKD